MELVNIAEDLDDTKKQVAEDKKFLADSDNNCGGSSSGSSASRSSTGSALDEAFVVWFDALSPELRIRVRTKQMKPDSRQSRAN